MNLDLEFQFLLGKIQKIKSVDFSLYRSGTVKRRIQSRLRATGCENYSDYLAYLGKHSREYDLLLDAMTINVTEFFRDPRVFGLLEKKVIPHIIQEKEKSGRKSIRVWSAGCSHGQESSSLAMLFFEALEQKRGFHLQIFGTDIDPKCIEAARAGIYDPSQIRKIHPDFTNKYFTFDGAYYQLRRELRDVMRFNLHNMVSDKPLQFMDLVLCRNVLIYFTRPLQESVCRNFADALNGGGFLVLGKVESLLGPAVENFRAINLHERIYQKTGKE